MLQNKRKKQFEELHFHFRVHTIDLLILFNFMYIMNEMVISTDTLQKRRSL